MARHRFKALAQLRRASCGAWLALLALGLNALVPIHLALDFGEAAGAAHRGPPAAARSLEWRLLALLSGHDAGDSKPASDGHAPSCPAYGAPGVCPPIAAPAPPIPVAFAAPPAGPLAAGALDRAPTAAYRSRAPPLG